MEEMDLTFQDSSIYCDLSHILRKRNLLLDLFPTCRFVFFFLKKYPLPAARL